MDSFNAPMDRRRGLSASNQAAQHNATLSPFSQTRTQAGVPSHWSWSDDPWTPLGFATPGDGPTRQQILGAAGFQTSYQDFRSKPLLSECDTCPDDSAYGSRLTQSIGNISAYGENPDADAQTLESHNPEAQLVGRNLESLQLSCDASVNSQYGTWNRPPPPQSIVTAPAGGERLTVVRKHVLKHTLPFSCDVQGCSRDKGFTSKNDLDRHKRTVHGDRTVAGRTFVCPLGPCAKKHKLWPRADNFRSHLQRIHGKRYRADDDLSEYVHRPPPSQDLEGVGGSAMAYMQTQDQPFGFSHHPSGLVIAPSYHGHYGEEPRRRSPQSQANNNAPPQSSTSISFDRDASSLAPVQEGSETFIPPDVLSGAGHNTSQAAGLVPTSPSRWRLSNPTEQGAASSENVSSESEQRDGPLPVSMDDMSQDDKSETEAAQDSNVEGHGPMSDVRMADAGETRPVSSAVASQEWVKLDSANFNKEFLKVLDKIPKDLLEDYLKTRIPAHKDDAPRQDAAGNKNQAQLHKCSHCPKNFSRQCELKKHLKRHSKPYGCTFVNCTKAFGSKNDWKRHESIQHYQLETWKCDYIKPDSGEACGKECHRRESFRNHLTKEHSILDSSKVEEKLDNCRKGRHCDARFWCGFCVETIQIPETDNAWAKRCDHIDDHFSGRGRPKKHISEWRHEDPKDNEVNRHRDSESQSSPDSPNSDPKSPDGAVPRRSIDVSAQKEGRNQSRQRETYMWTCCICSEEINFATGVTCFNCNHNQRGCQACVVFSVPYR
ncbi:hypothetical protein NM208_g10419 [Fusarium decemcellulare]|uniref:Uncharacterized protein n=1 Tax=Fusarium decemcellulare TaxID=57161 RepID=A0ACC1RY14_9HYPO|nr:hypothetical protein NM208_g10419 [Fusarium decemcellulare]